jgi:hypothetical protein
MVHREIFEGFSEMRSKHLNTLFSVFTAHCAVALWLRHYATNRQIAGSIPDGVIGIFQ